MHVFIHGQRVARTLCIIYVVLVRAALIGFGRQGGSSSCKFYTRPLARLEYYLYLIFLKGVFQNLGYLFALASQPCLIWTVS